MRPTRRVLLKAGLGCIAAAGAPLRAQSAARQSSKTSTAGVSLDAEPISPVMRLISEHVAAARDSALPGAVAEAARLHLLDTLAAMISGSRLLPGRQAIAYVQALGGTPEACVPGTKLVTNAVNAALAGGMLAHADETDDTHAPSIVHPGCSTVPAALAIAERQRAGGAELLRAVTLGYDVSTRLVMALQPYEFSPAGHSTSTFGGTFGAAAACATLLRLTPEQVRHVFSFAAQQSGGLSNFSRDRQHVEKSFVFGGLPARNGAAAATMVASGMTGIDDAFSGDRNFFFAYSPHADPAALVRGLGETYEITRTTIKRWSVAAPIQAPLDSLSYLIKTNHLRASDVERVVVRVSHQGVHSANEGAMPDINMQQMIAVMLLDGTVTMAAAHDVARMQDPAVLALRRRIELVGDDELERALPSQQGIVELTLTDGRVLRHHTTDVRGTAPNPMTADEVEEKADGLLTPVFGRPRARAVIDAIRRIESIADVRTLRPLFTA